MVLTGVVSIFERHLYPMWINVPKSAEEKKKIALAFYAKHKIPDVIGCVDGTHVEIIAPAEDKHLFFNQNGKFSLNVTLVSFLSQDLLENFNLICKGMK